MSYTSKVHEDPQTGDLYIELPEELLEELGWKEGDTLIWECYGSKAQLRKKDASAMEQTK